MTDEPNLTPATPVRPQGRATQRVLVEPEVCLYTSDELGYEWLPAADPRLDEVRTLIEVDAVGRTGEREPGADNLLIRGESFHAMNALLGNPDLAAKYRGRVKLVYIDPPFNTGKQFAHYDDALAHDQWTTMMRDRMTQIRELLSDEGTMWLHLDEAEESYGKTLADEVFGRRNYLGAVVWRKATGSRNDARFFSVDHDTIHVFAKDKAQAKFNRMPRTAEMNAAYTNPDNDPRGPWTSSACTAASGRDNMVYPIVNPAGREIWPPKGTFWRYSKKRFEELLAEDRIVWKNKGDSVPYFKRFLSDVADVVNRTWWDHEEAGHGPLGKQEITALFPHAAPFSTPKPEKLLARIIAAASDPGDIVLDCFGGSGTTAAVAHKMSRRWVTIEWSMDTFCSFIEPRLRRIVAGDDMGGITKNVAWLGGGGFKIVEVAPSAFATEPPATTLAVALAEHRQAETDRGGQDSLFSTLLTTGE